MDTKKFTLTSATLLAAVALSCTTVGCNRDTRSKTDLDYSTTPTHGPATTSSTMSMPDATATPRAADSTVTPSPATPAPGSTPDSSSLDSTKSTNSDATSTQQNRSTP